MADECRAGYSEQPLQHATNGILSRRRVMGGGSATATSSVGGRRAVASCTVCGCVSFRPYATSSCGTAVPFWTKLIRATTQLVHPSTRCSIVDRRSLRVPRAWRTSSRDWRSRGSTVLRVQSAVEATAWRGIRCATAAWSSICVCCAGSPSIRIGGGGGAGGGPWGGGGGGGAMWRDVDAPLVAHGLTMPGGTFDTTGVAGLTLGGGLGHLMGVYGLTLDRLVSAEVVLASGQVVIASAMDEPELFWALRGGGGNFGVVTEFEFALELLPRVFGGIIRFGPDELAD